jgi:hypothetical protein
VEASTFGSKLTAMKNAVEMTEALRCKLRVFGVPIEGPTNIFCDDGAVCANTTRPESTLTKKHHSVACHRSREAVAAGTVRVSKEHTSTNLADMFTKTMPALKREISWTNLLAEEASWSVCFYAPRRVSHERPAYF